MKRIYIPMPDADARLRLLENELRGEPVNLRRGDLSRIVAATEGYSASDLAALCKEAAHIPIRCGTCIVEIYLHVAWELHTVVGAMTVTHRITGMLRHRVLEGAMCEYAGSWARQ